MTNLQLPTVTIRLLVILTLLLGASLSACQAQHVTYLDQGWDDDTRQEFYYTPQGSELIRYSWFMALEQSD
ncbi:MAG: hypothetical protein ACI8P0_000839 [Planctomycetaceae bacterium]|jgi:hypothetical protein